MSQISVLGRRTHYPDTHEEVFVISPRHGTAKLLTHPIDSFTAHPEWGITHPTIQSLRDNTQRLVRAEQRKLRRAEDQERHYEELQARRIAQQDKIQALLTTEHADWAGSGTHAAIRSYFNKYLRGRIDETDGVLSRWQCVVYFTLIAGHQGEVFTVRQAFEELQGQRVPIDRQTAFKQISDWLRRLYDLDLIDRAKGQDGFLEYWAITRGFMW